jgi:hypothetical protein
MIHRYVIDVKHCAREGHVFSLNFKRPFICGEGRDDVLRIHRYDLQNHDKYPARRGGYCAMDVRNIEFGRIIKLLSLD